MTEQSLDMLFKIAAENPEATPAFLKQLLASDIYCLGLEQTQGRIQFRMLETEQGEQAIAFFLSEKMIIDDLGDEPFIQLAARKLFSMTQGATLVLNPTSEFSKEFSAQEVSFLLNTEMV